MPCVPTHQMNVHQINKCTSKVGVTNMEVPQMQETWPVSPPMEWQQRITVSINNNLGNITQQPLPLRAIHCHNAYQQGNPLVEVARPSIGYITHQSATPPSVLEEETLYRCNIIAQLQGSYEMETSSGHSQVSVILPNVAGQVEQYAIAHRVSSDGKALPDQYIYDESSWFTLKSNTGNLVGILKKGSNMKHSVKWWNWNDESCTIWCRKGNVTFNLLQVEPKARRNSISSIRTVSTSPISVHPLDNAMFGSEENLFPNRAELLQQTTPAFPSYPPSGCFSSVDCLRSTANTVGLNVASIVSDEKQAEMFEVIKAHCLKNPLLFRKVVDWGTRESPSREVAKGMRANLSKGRLWVTAHSSGESDDETAVDNLDDMKGAYQEVRTGLWMQPDPEACGSVVQHRLCKDEHGCWMIERHDVESESWLMRAQELSDGHWVDLKNNRAKIRVNVVPMNKILDTLGEELLVRENDIEKSMDFLFTSCNQVKLSKLKGRNLKHHIANLKLKLEKRYALSFGVQVASTAEAIIQE